MTFTYRIDGTNRLAYPRTTKSDKKFCDFLTCFRVDAAGAQLSITYLASFANFGPFRVWAGGKPHSPGAVSVEVDGHRSKFSLPRVARFPSTSQLMRALRRGGSLWIENAGTADGPARVKILGVVSADCHQYI